MKQEIDNLVKDVDPLSQMSPKTCDSNLARSLSEQERLRTIFWNEYDPFIDLRMKWRASMVRHLFHILPGQKILEIGCGDGKFTNALNKVTRNECTITAVSFLFEIQDRNDEHSFQKGIRNVTLNGFPAQLESQKFDLIIAHHMLEDGSRNDFLCAIKSLLKPGGGLILFEPNPWNPYLRLRRVVQRLLPIKWKRPFEPISLNRHQILSVLSEIGYTQINALPYDFLYAPVPKFLLWPAQHLSLIMENMPYVRNFAGSLYVWAKKPALDDQKSITVDLCEHQTFWGKVSFVLPCHNEERNLSSLINGLKAFYGKYIFEIIVVDDNSTDDTAIIAEQIMSDDPKVHLIRRKPPNGVGRALRDGIKEAKGEFIVIMDSDFQHIIPEMRDLFDAVANGADVAIGSRFSRESVLANYPFTKICVNRLFHIFINLLVGKRCRDISNNLKIFRREVTQNFDIEFDDFAANAETGLKPILMGYNVVEVPISWMQRSLNMGLSSFQIIKTGPNYFRFLVRLVWRRIRGQLKNNKNNSSLVN